MSVSRFFSTLLVIALGSTFVAAANDHIRLDVGRRHHAVNLTERDVHLQKRFDNARFTYFEVGQNACGSYDHDSDFVSTVDVVCLAIPC